MIGTLLSNRYELIEKIGEGGMAQVYRAKDKLLNRFVAVKILKDEYSNDSEFVTKFKREASAAASLSDNNIVNIYDVGTQGNINYMVMEYIKGSTLKQIINQNGALEPARVIEIANQIAKALDCAHKNNIIHRDIKPHNVVVTAEGLVKVMDFGIAKISDAATITNTSKIMGSAHYFSPEQARGGFVDNRSDLYSLGIVMYEMATGKVPYDAESPVSVALKHIQEQVVPPINLNSKIPQSLNDIILKAIEKEPIKRYQSAKEMMRDLENIKSNISYTVPSSNIDSDETRVMEPIVLDDDNDDENDEDFDDEKPKKPLQKKKKIIILSLIAVLVIGLGFLGGYLIVNKGLAGKPSGKSVTVPKIIGMKKDEAEKKLKDLGLVMTVSAHKKSDKPAGTILECTPDEGSSVKTGDEVRVIISGKTDSAQTMPDLTEMDYDTAVAEINKLGLKLGKKSQKSSDTVGAGLVMEQTPTADSAIDDSTVVDLVLSTGPDVKYQEVPNVMGKNKDSIAEYFTSKNLKLDLKQGNPAPSPDQENLIYSMSIAGGAKVKEGTTVTVYYYAPTTEGKANTPPKDNTTKTSVTTTQAPATVTVPALKDFTAEAAQAQLKNAGINYSVVSDIETEDKNQVGKVASMSGATPGQQVDPTKVTIVLHVYKLKAKTP